MAAAVVVAVAAAAVITNINKCNRLEKAKVAAAVATMTMR